MGSADSVRLKGSGAAIPNLPQPAQGAVSLLQVISRCYQKGSIILTTNRSVASSGDIFHMGHHRRRHVGPTLFTTSGDSY